MRFSLPLINPSAHAAKVAAADRSSNAHKLALLICSIGNPGAKYANTLHSAAHTAIDQLALVRRFEPFRPSLQYSGRAAKGTLVAHGQNNSWESGWVLWKSGSLMNISGDGVKRAWNAFNSGGDMGREGKVLVVLHDELESRLGQLSVRWGGSPRGHNGLKSIRAALPNLRYATIGIGIGRPVSRDPAAVSRHVLRRMTVEEEDAVSLAGRNMIELLRDIEEGDKSNKKA